MLVSLEDHMPEQTCLKVSSSLMATLNADAPNGAKAHSVSTRSRHAFAGDDDDESCSNMLVAVGC